MNLFINSDLLILGAAIAAIGILGFVVLFQDPKSDTTRAFLAFSVISIIWGGLNYASYHATTVESSLWLWRLVIFTATWFCFGIFNLAYIFPNEHATFSRLYKIVIVPVTVITSILTLTPLVFESLTSAPIQG